MARKRAVVSLARGQVSVERADFGQQEEAARDAEESAHAEAAQSRADKEAAFGYRLERAEAYRARLGKLPDNTREETIGDIIDALIKAVASGDATELQAIAAEAVRIKAEIPKPSD